MIKLKISYMGSRRLTKIAKRAALVMFGSPDCIRVNKHSYARSRIYGCSEWIYFSILFGTDYYEGKVYVCNYESSSCVRITLQKKWEDSTGEKSYQVLNNFLLYDSNFQPLPAASNKIIVNKGTADERYFVYGIEKEAANT